MARSTFTMFGSGQPLRLVAACTVCISFSLLIAAPLRAQDQTQAQPQGQPAQGQAAQGQTASTAPPQDAGQGAGQDEGGAPKLDSQALRVLVAPIALYPDEVIAIVLPASTTGLQIVQAQQYLEKHKKDSSLKPNQDWDPSIIALLNYPDVLARMNADLDWVGKLGDAVINQQGDVMDAIQQIRNEAVASGYLKSGEKQVVTQEKETVVIKSADPQVVYVPDYNPDVVVNQTYVSAPPPAYYPPYPPYYAPAATFFVGMFVGAAISYGCDWGSNDIDIDRGDVNINNSFNRNTNVNRNDLNKYNIDRKPGQNGDKLTWQGNKKRPTTRPAGGNRPNGVAPANRANNNAVRPGGAGAGTKKPGQVQNRAGGARAGDRQTTGRSSGSLGNYKPSRQTAKDSMRGRDSLNTQRATPQRATPSRQGGGNRQGAFGGSSNGGRAGVQQSRGNRSMGNRGGGGGGVRRR